SEGEDLGEGSARRVIINESTTLSPSPSVLDFLHAQFCRCFLRSASRNFKLRYPELHSVRKSAPKERVASAFTLAEVLITLVIIGVIAAITVPTLINKTNNQEYVSKLKKAYSTLAQATNLIIAEEGTPKASVGGWASSSENMYAMYKKYLKTARECGSGTECLNQDTILYLNKQPAVEYYNGSELSKLVLADGVQVIFWTSAPTNTEYANCTASGWGVSNRCAWIYVDVNGAKKPNTLGRDFFMIALRENGIYPAGCEEDSSCQPNGTGNSGKGFSCTCKVLREGAMNY
ncbi:type II secretion system protein, partial [bacterium]|nr:type II secretion system protein [bacterium]